MRATLAAALILSCTIGPGAAARFQETPVPKTHTVVIQDMAFDPPALTVKAGDSVEWINKDAMPHNVFSKEGSIESEDLPEGKAFKFTARNKGEFPYLCTLHRSMKGTFTVE